MLIEGLGESSSAAKIILFSRNSQGWHNMLNLVNPIVIDFEFKASDGHVPVPHTMCAKELVTGTIHRFGSGQSPGLEAPPFPREYTLVAFAADAELGCYLALGWAFPAYVLDLRIEHMMCDRNTATIEHLGANLEQALSFYGMSHSYENKKEMQKLGGRGEPYTPEEATALVEYCLAHVSLKNVCWRCYNLNSTHPHYIGVTI